MDAALKQTIDELGSAVEDFKDVHKRVETLESKNAGHDDLKEQLGKVDAAVSELSKAKEKLDTDLKSYDEWKAANDEAVKSLRDELEDLHKRSFSRNNGGDDKDQDTVEHEKAYNKFLRKGREDGLAELEMKTLQTTVDADGGFAVPEELDRQLIEIERQLTPMRQLAAQITVSTPDYKKLVNLGGAASGWVGETDARPETASPTLAQIQAKMGEVYANPASTQTALDDMFVDVEAWLAQEVGVEFAEQENTAFTTGNGTNKALGLMSATTAETTDKAGTRAFGTFEHQEAAAATAVTGDELIDLIHALRPGYRGRASWMFTGLTLAALRKLKDSDGNYLWRPGLEQGVSSQLLGYGYTENEDMPEMVTGANAIAFADFMRAYLVVDRIGTRVLRDPYTAKPNVHFYTTKRVGGMPIDSLAAKFIQMA